MIRALRLGVRWVGAALPVVAVLSRLVAVLVALALVAVLMARAVLRLRGRTGAHRVTVPLVSRPGFVADPDRHERMLLRVRVVTDRHLVLGRARCLPRTACAEGRQGHKQTGRDDCRNGEPESPDSRTVCFPHSCLLVRLSSCISLFRSSEPSDLAFCL